MFTYLRYNSTTTKIVTAVLISAICCNSRVTAQFSNCVTDTETEKAICSWSESPIVLTDDITDLGTFAFNENVVLFAVCDAGAPFAIRNCGCEISVQDSPFELDANDFCDSCTLRYIEVYSFGIFWDCSNKDIGACPVFTADGCQSSTPPTNTAPSSASGDLRSGGHTNYYEYHTICISSVLLTIMSMVFIH